jgi:hypothetical protein
MAIDFPAFESNLRRWYAADRLGAAEIRELHQRAEQALADPGTATKLVPLFRPDNQAAFGLAWWEERAKAGGDDVDISELDELNMLLSYDLDFARKVQAKPYCPPELVGTWSYQGWFEEDGGVQPPAGPRSWTLQPDGHVAAVGDPEVDGNRWMVHLDDDQPVLWFKEGRGPARKWRIWDLSGDQMEATPPGKTGGSTRWKRTRS